jgi:hypothetical protein
MSASLIFVPVAGMFVLTLAVWIVLYQRRIAGIRSTGIELKVRADLDRLPAPAVDASNNFQNLFEMPVLFYACVLALHQLGRVDALHVACAFGFFGFRVAHSAIHCTSNQVMQRFTVYAISSVFLWVMVIRFAIAVVGDAFA